MTMAPTFTRRTRYESGVREPSANLNDQSTFSDAHSTIFHCIFCLLYDLIRPQEQRLGDRVTQRGGGLDGGHSKAMTASPAATWIAPSKSSTPSTTCPFVVT